jgi:hypothetical protein
MPHGTRAALPPLPGERHVCGTCRFGYADTDAAGARGIVGAVPGRTRAAALAARDPRLRPRPGTWSVLEYVCHLRDVYVSSTIRVYRVRTEDRPQLEPMLNDLRARRFRYNERDLAPVLAELADTAAGFLDEVDRVRPRGWGRTATRLPGEERTALWLVRHAAHEGLHHVSDIEELTALASG